MTDINLKFYDYSHVYVDTSHAIFHELKDQFSFFVDGYKFSPKFLYGTWDGKISLLDKDCLLPYGLVKVLVTYAIKNKYTISIHPEIKNKYDLSREDFDTWIDSRKYYSGQEEIYPYWYQLESIYESLVYKRRILNLPTSAGKSLIQALLTKYVIEKSEMNVLIIVPTVNLVNQMKDDFVDYRLFTKDEIAEVKAGSNQTNERVVVSTWQSAIKKPAKWFQQFGMLLCDEVHLAIGNSISTIIKKLQSCEYKIGLSGSLRDGKANLMQYIGLFGSVISPTTTSELMIQGQISKLKINCLLLKYPLSVQQASAKWSYQEEIKFITKLKQRTNWVCALANKLSSKNENVFVMFKHKEHGREIYERMKEIGHKKIYYVAGEIHPDRREEIKKCAETDSGVVIIASYGVFSTGISVKNLHHVIFSHPVKSKTTVLQTIGRVLRKHHSKSLAQLWDLIDDMSIMEKRDGRMVRTSKNAALRHALDRIVRYKLEKFEFELLNVDFLK